MTADRQGFRKGARVVPGYVSPDFKRRLAALTPDPTPTRWFIADALALLVSVAAFALLCGLRCG